MDLQLKQARKLIDIFKNEDKYKMADGRTCADWLSKWQIIAVIPIFAIFCD